MTKIGAIVLAAGQGRRMGADKALLDLEGQTAVQRVVAGCWAAGVEWVGVVRASGAAALPGDLPGDPPGELVEITVRAAGGEMLDSIRAGVAALPDSCTGAIIFPVDYALVSSRAVRAVVDAVREGHQVVLPIADSRPGHPIGLSRACLDEVRGEIGSLRDVVASDRARVHAVQVEDPWVHRDLDTPEDLAAARGSLRSVGGTATELMRRHRSVRRFHPDPIPDAQLEWCVDSARYASTSSFIQAYSAVAVSDPNRRAEVSLLCGDQRHVREAPVFLAICADLHRIRRCCERHDAEMRSGPLEGFVEALVDAALFAQNLLLAAESEGLAGCMIGGARQQPQALAELLELPTHVFVAFGLVLGRPAEQPEPRGRLPLSSVLHRETYRTEGLEAALDAADQQMRSWAKAINEQGGYGGRLVNETKGWTDRMAAKWSHDFGPREALAEQLRGLGFGLE